MTEYTGLTPLQFDYWNSWMAENLARGCAPDALIPGLTSGGIAPEKALQMLDDIQASPQLKAMKKLVEERLRREWLIRMQDQLKREKGTYKVARIKPLPFQKFYEKYYLENLPVILRGAIDHWPARHWTPESLRERVGHAPVEVQFGREADDRFEENRAKYTRDMMFDEYVDLVLATKSSNDFYMAASNSAKSRPSMVHLCDDFADVMDGYFDQSVMTKQSYIWLGPKGTFTPLHHDLTNNFFAQVYGRKRIWLIPPLQVLDTYNSFNVYCDVDPRRVDYEQFPAMRNVTMLEVIVKPGDCLFIPIGWLHAVESLDTSISITFNNFKVPNHYPGYPLSGSRY